MDCLDDAVAETRILARIKRMQMGNLGDWKSVGGGVHEMRITHGRGYRIYFTRRGTKMVILLAGGTKRTQAADIAKAQRMASEVWGKEERAMKLTKFDAAAYLKSPRHMALYLDACIREGGDDPAFIASALGDIARARGMNDIAAEAGMTKAGLYKALSRKGNPSFGAILKVVHAMGLELHVTTRKRAA